MHVEICLAWPCLYALENVYGIFFNYRPNYRQQSRQKFTCLNKFKWAEETYKLCVGWMRGLKVFLSLSCRFTFNAKKLWVESRHIDCILINEYLFILTKICKLRCQNTTLLSVRLDIIYVVLRSINFCSIYNFAERNFNRGSIVRPDISKSLLETVTKYWKVSLRGSHSPKYGLNKKTFVCIFIPENFLKKSYDKHFFIRTIFWKFSVLL